MHENVRKYIRLLTVSITGTVYLKLQKCSVNLHKANRLK